MLHSEKIYTGNKLKTNYSVSFQGTTNQDEKTISELIHNICKKYNYDERFVKNFCVQNLDYKLYIFDNEINLLKYIQECYKIYDTFGTDIFNSKDYNEEKKIIELKTDYTLIQKIALLNCFSDTIKTLTNKLCYLLKTDAIDILSFKNTIRDIKSGYISHNTIDIALSSALIENKHIKTENLYNTKSPSQIIKQKRKTIIKTLTDNNTSLQKVLKNLEKEINNDIYNARWELLSEKHITEEQIHDFITDIPNIKYMKQTEILPEYFYVNIEGFDKNKEWANDMAEITNYAMKLIDERNSFDIVMSEISKLYREADLSRMINQNFDEYKAVDCGKLRCDKNGYISNNMYNNIGASTPVNDKHYEKYKDRFFIVANHKLTNPYPNILNLTRIQLFKKNNNTQIEYIALMLHPEGKHAIAALEFVGQIHSFIINNYSKKDLTQADLENINEKIGEIHWVLSHSMPWARGSAGISDVYIKSLYKSLAIKISGPKNGISYDLEAFCTEFDTYNKNYKKLYKTEPILID